MKMSDLQVQGHVVCLLHNFLCKNLLSQGVPACEISSSCPLGEVVEDASRFDSFELRKGGV